MKEEDEKKIFVEFNRDLSFCVDTGVALAKKNERSDEHRRSSKEERKSKSSMYARGLPSRHSFHVLKQIITCIFLSKAH
jgi:hypothetical protein